MNPEIPIDPAIRRRNRIMLVMLMLVFLVPVTAAVLLHMSDWRPSHTRNHGELLSPPPSLADIDFRHADGSVYKFSPQERRWQVAVAPPEDCIDECRDLIAGLDKVWRLQGRRADRLHVLWFGPVPEGATTFRTLVPMQRDAELLARFPKLPTSGKPSVYLIDPNAFLAMYYAPDFDLVDLRADIAQLLK